MKQGLLVVLAVVVLVPSLSEGRNVSICELREKLGEALTLPRRLERIKDQILAIVICEVDRRSGLDTGRVRVFGKRKTTTAKPTTTTFRPTTTTLRPPTTSRRPTTTTGRPATTTRRQDGAVLGFGDIRQKREVDIDSSVEDLLEDGEIEVSQESEEMPDVGSMADEDEEVTEDVEDEMPDADGVGSEEDGGDMQDVDNMGSEEDDSEMADLENMLSEDEESDEADIDEEEVEEGGKRKKRGFRRWKVRMHTKHCSLGFYGLFQLSDKSFCDSGYCRSRNKCNTGCGAFTDDDIMDDISCVVKTQYWRFLVKSASPRCYHTKNFFDKCP